MSTPANIGVVISAKRVVTPTKELAPGWVETRGDRIRAVGSGKPPRAPDLDVPAGSVVPGFVDTHAHGGGGGSFSTTDRAEVEQALDAHLRHGTTSMVASLVTAPAAQLVDQISFLADLAEQDLVAGIHLEGPWLSETFKGAHHAASLTTPTADAVGRLLAAGRGFVRMVTLAPELEHGLEAVGLIRQHGAVVAVGHTAAGYDTVRAAVDAGATVATHLFNAMPTLHHREPGPALALLEDPRVTVELIIDGVHLHSHVAALAARCAAGRFTLITDAMAAAGARDGTYRLGELDVQVHDGKATLANSCTIAGSTLTLHQAVRNAVSVGISLSDAVRAATVTPATQLGLGGIGTLEPGHRADLVVLSDDLAVQQVMYRGAWLTSPA